ncbi:protein phosphatase PTC7 homolog isoform X1 [Drosophila novamexicana]|uniref:protein phosphatase PTC7 homolog isoform X1 n=2 Tax=Drosophila novamexicana TaxID=47314 RepID=UPI0011E5AF66|nr:protein phosphatase PTC7 homolog isoform X1 [Drosophila novamexicana]XP_030563284.1 protein phosphatase PTC7 homolog isoform X1 [Drosophila novamexicana]
MNEYLDNARRNIQRTMNSSYHSLSEVASMAGSLAASTGSQLYSSLMSLKAQVIPSANEPISPTPSASELGSSTMPSSSQQIRLISVVCGFPKDIGMYPDYARGQFGEDAWFRTSTSKADALGVADGVGGWRVYGIDPGQFSRFLMRSCERLAHSADFESTRPEQLLARAYCNLLEQKQPILGSCTACVLTLHRDSGILYAANIGDSGLLVIRNGAIVCRSLEQQHHFNTPYQLAVPPPGQGLNVLTDGPECAALLEFDMQIGDILILATDGVYDNVSEDLLLQVLTHASGVTDPVKLQMFANSVALMARSLSFNPNHESPFTQNARRHNIDAPGGKPDDITVVLASVV